MKSNKEHNIYLLKEFEEINSYMRMVFSIGISWYTFFITANTFAIGLLGSDTMGNNPLSATLFTTISILFFCVNLLAVAICPFAINFCRKQDQRINSIVNVLNTPDNKETNIQSPIPLALAVGLIRLMQLSLIGTTFFWIAFPLGLFQ